ncbi:MAG: hypothetical protein Q4D57_01465 [Clostridia bacterium]|nr:hypothetical protein [Clostridia bacterium]
MKNTKMVTVQKLSDDSLENISGGMIGDVGYFIIIGGITGLVQGAIRLTAAGLLIGGGAIGTIACAVASGKQFSKGNIAAGSGLAAGAAGSAGAVAAGAALLKKHENY